MKNSETLKFCVQFTRDVPLGLGVMLYGEWGCGKTWFVKENLIKELKGQPFNKDRTIVYVSLNGAKSSEQVMTSIAQEWITENSKDGIIKKAMGSLASVFSAADKAADKVNHWSSNGIKSILQSIAAGTFDRVLASRRPIIILDDFERFNVSENESLSLINKLGEQLKLHVFVLCNLTEAKSKHPELSRLMEKAFGWQIKIQAEVEKFVKYETDKIAGQRTKSFVLSRNEMIAGIANRLDAVNLRSLRMSIRHFEMIDEIVVSELPAADMDKYDDARERILRRTMAGTITARDGGITCKEVLDLIHYRMVFSANENDPGVKERKAKSRMLTDIYFDDNISLSDENYGFIPDVIDSGRLRHDLIKDLCRSWRGEHVAPGDRDLYTMASGAYFRESDEDYQSMVLRCLTAIESGDVVNPESFRTLARSLFYHSSLGLISINKDDMREKFKISCSKTTFSLNEYVLDEWLHGYEPARDADDKFIIDIIAARISDQDKGELSQMGLDKIRAGILPFTEWACDKQARCYKLPMFCLYQAADFWNGYFQLSNNDRCDVEARISGRLAHVEHLWNLSSDEKKWISDSVNYIEAIPDSSLSRIAVVQKNIILNKLKKYI